MENVLVMHIYSEVTKGELKNYIIYPETKEYLLSTEGLTQDGSLEIHNFCKSCEGKLVEMFTKAGVDAKVRYESKIAKEETEFDVRMRAIRMAINNGIESAPILKCDEFKKVLVKDFNGYCAKVKDECAEKGINLQSVPTNSVSKKTRGRGTGMIIEY